MDFSTLPINNTKLKFKFGKIKPQSELSRRALKQLQRIHKVPYTALLDEIVDELMEDNCLDPYDLQDESLDAINASGYDLFDLTSLAQHYHNQRYGEPMRYVNPRTVSNVVIECMIDYLFKQSETFQKLEPRETYANVDSLVGIVAEIEQWVNTNLYDRDLLDEVFGYYKADMDYIQ